MFHFIAKSLISYRIVASKASYVRYIQTLSSLNSASNSKDQQFVTVSYLTNSCGLSLDQAISASKFVNIDNKEKPDLVLKLLENHGFTKSDIASLISKQPSLILCRPESNLKPKIEFFRSLGVVGPDLLKILCNKLILSSSLENRIMPNVDFLRGLLGTNENVVYALKQYTTIVRCNAEKVMLPNISTLRAHGVPEANIRWLIMSWSRVLVCGVDLFEEGVNEVKEMGFEPTSKLFIFAVRCMFAVGKSKWERKQEILMSYGWSGAEILSAFRQQPMVMVCSEKKIRESMDFYVNKVGLKPCDVAKYPNLFLASLEMRVIPRCSVLKVLKSKGLIKKNVNIASVLTLSNNRFEKKFVTEYKEDYPEVTSAYQGKIGFKGFSDKM